MINALEQAIAKVRDLSEDKQALAAELLEELARDDFVYVMSADERAVLADAMNRVVRRQFATDIEVQALWRKCGI